MLISSRKVSIPLVADAKLPIFWPGSTSEQATLKKACAKEVKMKLYSTFSNLCDLFLSSHSKPIYTRKVKVIKYFLQVFVIWNNGAGKNEGQGTHFGKLSYWHFAMGIDA